MLRHECHFDTDDNSCGTCGCYEALPTAEELKKAVSCIGMDVPQSHLFYANPLHSKPAGSCRRLGLINQPEESHDCASLVKK